MSYRSTYMPLSYSALRSPMSSHCGPNFNNMQELCVSPPMWPRGACLTCTPASFERPTTAHLALRETVMPCTASPPQHYAPSHTRRPPRCFPRHLVVGSSHCLAQTVPTAFIIGRPTGRRRPQCSRKACACPSRTRPQCSRDRPQELEQSRTTLIARWAP
jgi:hypothetical protein